METIRRPRWAIGCSDELTPEDARNLRRLYVVGAVWYASFIGGLLLLDTWAEGHTARSLLVATVPALLLVPTVRASARFLREADELTRKIHVEAMAIGFGAGMIAQLLSPTVETVAGASPAPRLGAELLDLADPITVALFAWFIALASRRRAFGSR
jgi:hypothetical protein